MREAAWRSTYYYMLFFKKKIEHTLLHADHIYMYSGDVQVDHICSKFNLTIFRLFWLSHIKHSGLLMMHG